MDKRIEGEAGCCRYCGQTRMIMEKGLSEEERNERATLSCVCKEGREYRAEVEEKKRIQQMIKDSKSITAAQLGKDLPDIQDLADRLIPEIVKLSIDKVQISLEATKIAIKYDGSSLAITRTDVKRQKDEAHR